MNQPRTQHNDYMGDATIDAAPWKGPIESLLDEATEHLPDLGDLRVVGFEYSVAREDPVLTLFAVDARGAASTVEAARDQGESVQCFAYVIDSWTEGFDQLFEQYFDEARIRVWNRSVLGDRTVEIIGEQG